jgi:general secretion pathway protein K
MEWLGRSGIELAKWTLSQQGPAGQQYDALNQLWAGGDCDTNEIFAGISLKDNRIGHGTFSVKIIDNDRKLNINLAAAAPEIVNQALILIGVDAAEAPRIVNAIADWIDRDDQSRLGGETETDYYQSLDPPYRAKNGPIDDLTELMFIKGITPAMYYGSGGVAAAPGAFKLPTAVRNFRGQPESYPIGFVDLFTTVSGRFININTASANTMQLIPDVDGALAQAIITTRAGPDGADGTCDDMPFRSIGELSNVPGMTPALGQMFARYFSTRSSTFEVQVDVEIDAVKRSYFAMLRRNGQRIDTLYMYWR